MSLHSPFGYIEEEKHMLKVIITCIEELCINCHTNDDFKNGCHSCHAGRLIRKCASYFVRGDNANSKINIFKKLFYIGKKILNMNNYMMFKRNWLFSLKHIELELLEYLEKRDREINSKLFMREMKRRVDDLKKDFSTNTSANIKPKYYS